MPNMNGYEASEQILLLINPYEKYRDKNIIVMCTAYEGE